MDNDGNNCTILKYCCPYIILFSGNIINFCIIQHKFPKAWKEAQIIPLFKVSKSKRVYIFVSLV